jgi:hypothetical protein
MTSILSAASHIFDGERTENWLNFAHFLFFDFPAAYRDPVFALLSLREEA